MGSECTHHQEHVTGFHLTTADVIASVTYTVEGSTGLSLECYTLFGGTQCETVTHVNVIPSQLAVTSINLVE